MRFVVANWKMNPGTLKEAKELFGGIKKRASNLKNIQVIVCPPFIYLPELIKMSNKIKVGAQDLFWGDLPSSGGAFTGEVSANQLKALGCDYVIVGHSERKAYFGETNVTINKKIKMALKYNLIPIFLFGETIKEKKNKLTQKSLVNQIRDGLRGIKEPEMEKIILAYEPVWAIGGKKACSTKETYEINLFLKNFIAKEYSVKLAEMIPVLYGGSVNAKNAKEYIAESISDGVLAGSSSLRASEFTAIIKSVSNI